MKELNQAVDGWEERPYGWKKMLGPKSQLLRLNPHSHTAMSATAENLGPHQLKENDAKWEHVEFVGYVDGEDEGGFDLRYVFLPRMYEPSEQPRQQSFGKGAKFYSVLPDVRRTGFYHDLHNDSDYIIELRCDWE